MTFLLGTSHFVLAVSFSLHCGTVVILSLFGRSVHHSVAEEVRCASRVDQVLALLNDGCSLKIQTLLHLNSHPSPDSRFIMSRCSVFCFNLRSTEAISARSSAVEVSTAASPLSFAWRSY